MKQISKYIPGTTEYSYEERKYLQKVRDVTAKRVEQYSAVFEALSKSFIQSAENQTIKNKWMRQITFLSLVTEKTCQHVFYEKEMLAKQI